MDLGRFLNDERLLANLIGIHVVLGVLLLISIVLRKLLKSGDSIGQWTGFPWLDSFAKEAVKGMRSMLFWTTIVLMIASVASMALYHMSGRHAQSDVTRLADQLTGAHLASFGLVIVQLVGLAIGGVVALRVLRRLRVFAETFVHHHLPRHVHPELSPAAPLASLGTPSTDKEAPPESTERHRLENTIRRWFTLLERFATILLVVGGVWLAARVVGFAEANAWAGLVLQIVTIFMVARLLTLSCGTLFHVFANLGNRYLNEGRHQRYWERVVRLFPFGEKCFDAAVWVFAASQCVEAIHLPGEYGRRIVACIGILFGTRVAIELLHVFINQAFGMYKEDRAEDQKARTLVPLLESVSQYVVYFGSALMMLRVFNIETTPFLAGAGVVGLAFGLGAQNLVADMVAGFFILFDNQFMVGDVVQIGDAMGKVEAINIRTTHIRDESGKLVIIPNGQIKTVINFSKGYVNAVVDIKVPTSLNLDEVMRDMTEAGKRLRERRREVIGETIIKGLVELTPNDMVVRAVTKVQPGTHLTMQQEYRRILKEVFDESPGPALKARAA